MENTKYYKQDIVKSQKYANYKYLLDVILINEKTYTLNEVEKLIKAYKERKI